MSISPPPAPVTQPYWWPLPPLQGRPAPLEALVDGEAVETAHGRFFLRRQRYDADERYGGIRLCDFLWLNPRTAAALGRVPDLCDVALDRVLFLDTETTGLAGGTGTYAFLVGLGYFEHGGAGESTFVLDQCMMRSFGEERAMLSWIAERLDRFEALVTFNGRTFDVPLLQTRFLMSRLRLDLEEWVHFDLLPPARRLWRPAVQSCALQNLERNILRVGRDDDIESFLIPAIFHQYLRDGDGRYLQRVFNHNRADILALVALAVRACSMLDQDVPEEASGEASGEARGDGATPGARVGRPVLAAAEYVGLARVYEQMGSLDAAERSYRAALAGRLPADLRCRTLMGLAALLKRRRRHDDAAVLWQVVVDEAPAHSVPALVELAKYWEHQRRDAGRAYELATRARDRWLAGLPAQERPLPALPPWQPAASPAPPSPPDDFLRRLGRLDRKRSAAGVP